MKAIKFNIMLAAVALVAVCLSGNAQNKVIYTGEIAKKVIGYNGTTPLNITIKDGKIANIEVLDNEESPNYLKKATSKIFPQYIGKTIKEALNLKADVASGATYTSNALIENIKLGLKNELKQTPSGKGSTNASGKVKRPATRKACKIKTNNTSNRSRKNKSNKNFKRAERVESSSRR